MPVYRNIPTVLTADEILEKAFKRANKIQVQDKDRLRRERRMTQDRLNSLSNVIEAKLQKYVKTFPSLNKEAVFEEALIDLLIGADKMKHSLGALQWASKTVNKIAIEMSKKVRWEKKSLSKIVDNRKEAYGRISSVLKKVDKELTFLADAREKLKKMPTIDPKMPTAVVAGAPNVGKSKLVKRLSTAEPEVASYPFTTKELHVGVFEHRHLRYQVLDTPGLLDRSLDKRNEIEKQAILALRFLPHLIVFLLDPADDRNISLEEQKHLHQSLQNEFAHTKHIMVYNKADLKPAPAGEMGVSALTGEGVEELRTKIVEILEPIHMESDALDSYVY
ncbi:MAG: 50S ribosome-binding GTPase [Thermoplasmata archaeon]|nr:50S ribosome-binding GTPase [Thermoplasmata archaeon]